MASRARGVLAELPGVRSVEERAPLASIQAFAVTTEPQAFTAEAWRGLAIANLSVLVATADGDAVATVRAMRTSVATREPTALATLREARAVLTTHVGAVQAGQWLLRELVALGDLRAPAGRARAWDPRLDEALAIGEELLALNAATTGLHPPIALPTDFAPPMVLAEPLLVLQLRALQGKAVAPWAQAAVDQAWQVAADLESRVRQGLAVRQARGHLLAAAQHLHGIASAGRDAAVTGQALRIARRCDELIAGIDLIGAPW
ncbi:MAG: hypothetical protein IPK26_30105 [Planctomycetes bacterium]|nr:hypothetical protein [Planctomycetota bacterium]